MGAPHKPAAAMETQQPKTTTSKTKPLSLSEAICKWRSIGDQQTVARLEKLLQQPACGLDGTPKPALSESTVAEYSATLRLLQARLAEDWTGQPRHALPSFIECLLRPNGPKFVAQFLADPAEGRRIAICMTSVVTRCFASLDAADKERAVKAWRTLLSEFRKEYIQSRDRFGGFGGYVDEGQLLSSSQIQTAIEKLPMGSGERMIVRLFEVLVSRFPDQYKVTSPLLNLGHIKVMTADSAPSISVWAREVAADDSRESGLLVLSEPPRLLLLFAEDKDGPVATQYDLRGSLAAELNAYLSKLPLGLNWLFPQVKGEARNNSKAYDGHVGRDSFNARINRILLKVFGDAAVTQTTFRLSLVNAQRQQHESNISTLAGTHPLACVNNQTFYDRQQSESGWPGYQKQPLPDHQRDTNQ